MIRTWTEPATLEYLAKLAQRSSFILECGTYTGASAKAMLDANPKLHLTCIDTFECRNESMMSDYPAGMTTKEICEQITLKKEIEEGRCKLIVGDSKSAVSKLNAMFEAMFDAIWVDDGHLTEDVLRDIHCLMPFLRDGGEMCGHDFDVPYNDVALGVIQSGIKFDVPIPRVWRHIK